MIFMFKKTPTNHHKKQQKTPKHKQDQHYHIQKAQYELKTWFLLSSKESEKSLL